MKNKYMLSTQNELAPFDDLVRTFRAQETVGLSPGSILRFHKAGLPLYGIRSAYYFSISDLAKFVQSRKAKRKGNCAFDSVPVSCSSKEVGLCPQFVKELHGLGLPFYRVGGVLHFRMSEFNTVVRNHPISSHSDSVAIGED